MIINIVLYLVYLLIFIYNIFFTTDSTPFSIDLVLPVVSISTTLLLLPLFVLAIPMVIYYKVKKQKINQKLITRIILIIGIIFYFFLTPYLLRELEKSIRENKNKVFETISYPD